MSKLSYVRMAIGGIVTVGVGKIIGDVLENNTDPKGTPIDRVTRKAGAYALGGMITASAVNYTDNKIREIALELKQAKANIDEENQQKK